MGEKHAVSAVVLAGGYASRMGRDKAELDFHGRSFAQHQVEKLKALGVSDILLSGYSKPLEGARLVPDVYPHRGPLSGIHAALLAAEQPQLLVLAVDTPLVPLSLLEELIEAHRAGVTLVTADEKWEPLIGVYDVALAPVCERLLRGQDSSLRALLRESELRTLAYHGDPRLLLNCNTPEDYRRLCEYEESGNGKRREKREL